MFCPLQNRDRNFPFLICLGDWFASKLFYFSQKNAPTNSDKIWSINKTSFFVYRLWNFAPINKKIFLHFPLIIWGLLCVLSIPSQWINFSFFHWLHTILSVTHTANFSYNFDSIFARQIHCWLRFRSRKQYPALSSCSFQSIRESSVFTEDYVLTFSPSYASNRCTLQHLYKINQNGWIIQ